MGIQAATVTKFNGVTIHTAFVTGTLIRFAETLSEWVIAIVAGKTGTRTQSFRDTLWFLSIWVSYVGGGVIGARLYSTYGRGVIVWVCTVLSALAVLDATRPGVYDTRI